MIDWYRVFTASLWLFGLALILSVVSFTSYARSMSRSTRREMWRVVIGSRWAQLGGLLFCVGMALSSGTWIEGFLWVLLGSSLAYEAWRTRATRPGPLVPLPGGSTVEQGAMTFRRNPVRSVAEWVVKTELLWLALLAPFFIAPAPERIIALVGLPLLWIARFLARRHFVPRTPLDWALAIFMLMILVSLYATFDMSFSLSKITNLLFGIGLYYALVDWASVSPRRLGWAIWGYAVASAGLVALGLLGTTWVNKVPALNQLTADLPPVLRQLSGEEAGFNANLTGGSLLWIVPLHLALAWWSLGGGLRVSRGRWAARFGLLILSAASVGTLLLSQSRGALSGFAFGVALLLWLTGKRARLILLAAIIVGIGVVLYFGPRNVSDRLTGEFGTGFSATEGVTSLSGRVEIWSRAIYGIEDFSFTGMGINTFRRVMPILYPLFSTAPDQDLGHAHNHLLQAALDLGLPGLVAYLSIWIIVTSLVVIAWRRMKDSLLRATIAGISAGLLAYFIFSMTDVVALGAKRGFYFWVLLALLVLVWRQSSARDTGQTEDPLADP